MKRHLLKELLALTLLLCLLIGSAASAQTYASLVEKLGEEAGLCSKCGEKTLLEIDESYHWLICQNEECSEYNTRIGDYHYASCVDASVCGVCGAPSQSGYVKHVYLGMPYITSETMHWQNCALCGSDEDVYQYNHSRSCQESACEVCGMADNGQFVVNHQNSGEYESDETYHWQICEACGEQCYYGEHRGYCEDRICTGCQAEITDTQQLYHNYDYSTYYQNPDAPDYHGYQCQNCEYISRNSTHTSRCTDPAVCEYCGVEYSGMRVNHNYDYSQPVPYPDDPDCHGTLCQDCGIISYPNEHCANCDAPDVCAECGAQGNIARISHRVDYDQAAVIPDRPGYHGFLCIRENGCGGYVSLEPHYAYCTDPDTCFECGVDYDGSNIEHDYDYSQMVPHPDDPNKHGYACREEGCGHVSDNGYHAQKCTEPGVCGSCGVAYEGSRFSHNPTWNEYASDESYHWLLCEDCGAAVNKSGHYASCVNPGECLTCGAACSGADVSHDYDWDEYSFDETHHWRVCLDCGESVYKERHFASCINPGECLGCGQAVSHATVSHECDWENYFSDANNHWHICLDCGEAADINQHYASCVYPGTCEECGAAYSGTNISHNCDWGVYASDADSHWYVCLDCDARVYMSQHRASCIEPGKCRECGIDYNGSRISHDLDWDDWKSDEDSHWLICMDCGKVCEKAMHSASCIDTDTCRECGASCSNTRVSHNVNWDSFVSDAAYHWQICQDCGEIAEKERHWAFCDVPGVCVNCGYEDDSIRSSHYFSLEDYVYDANYHWNACEGCGFAFNKEAHVRLCDGSEEKCTECGAAYSGANLTHVSGGEPAWDAYQHWYICELCGGMGEKEEHNVSCLNPGVCTDCGASVKAWSEDQTHSYSGEYGFNEYQHWIVCDDCGSGMKYSQHHASCATPGVCEECGYAAENMSPSHGAIDVVPLSKALHQVVCGHCGEAIWEEEHFVVCGDESMTCVDCGMTGVTGYWMEHLGLDESAMQSSAAGHHVPCINCGENVFESEHEADCANPAVCYICGAEVGSDVLVRHHPQSELSSDEAYHWQACMVCEGRTEPETHWDYYAPYGYCDYCAAVVGDIPPIIGLDEKTVYITLKGYGNVCEIYAYSNCGEDEGALTASSSDESVMTAEVIQTSGTENLLRLTGHKIGTATLTVTAVNGLTDTMQFIVEAAGNEIVLPADTVTVEDEAFAGANGIEFVYVSSGVTAIGENAFKNCTSLKCVYIPASVTDIGEGAFTGCKSVLICTTAGSAAQAYAAENGLSWIIE